MAWCLDTGTTKRTPNSYDYQLLNAELIYIRFKLTRHPHDSIFQCFDGSDSYHDFRFYTIDHCNSLSINDMCIADGACWLQEGLVKISCIDLRSLSCDSLQFLSSRGVSA